MTINPTALYSYLIHTDNTQALQEFVKNAPLEILNRKVMNSGLGSPSRHQ